MRKVSRNAKNDPSILEMALVGYEAAKAKIEAEIHSIQVQLGKSGKQLKKAIVEAVPGRQKRTLSARARRAISMAQKKRWSEARKAVKSTVKTAKATVKRAKAKVKSTVKAAKAKAADVVPF